MELIDRDALRGRFEELDKVLDAPLSLILVGGGAVVALVEDAESTKDIDYIRTKELDELLRTQGGQKLREIAEELGFSDHSHAFEAYLPEDYLERSRIVPELSGERLRVFVLSPEDLALMKLFRFASKDQSDIEKLTSLAGFDLERLRTSFLQMLPIVVGDRRWCAGSFTTVWNKLNPELPHTIEEVLEAAGIEQE